MMKTAPDARLNVAFGAVSACVLLCIREAALHFDPTKGVDDKAGEDYDRKEGAYEAVLQRALLTFRIGRASLRGMSPREVSKSKAICVCRPCGYIRLCGNGFRRRRRTLPAWALQRP